MRIKKIVSLTLSIPLSTMLFLSQMPTKAVAEIKQTKEVVKTAKELEYSEDSIIVKFKKDISEEEKESVKKNLGLSTEKKFSLTESEVVKTKDKNSVKSVVEKLMKDPKVLYAEPDYIVKKAAVVNDPSFGQLWGFDNTTDLDIDIPEAWDITKGSSETIVAVIDEGIDIRHPDIAQNIWTNPGEIPGDGIDNDGNGYIDDANGWDFFHSDNTVYDSSDGDDHGTHVAGTIAAVSDNGIGVAGVAPKVKIMPLKFLGPNGGYTSDAIEAIQYAQKMGARAANNSWGGGWESAALRDAINSFNGVFVAAAGNNSMNNDINAFYPSSYDCTNILSVAAVDRQGNLAYFSNYGTTSVDVAAPGVDILSLKPGSSYQYMAGTSMATPHVTGVASLILSMNPAVSPDEVCNIIRQGAVPMDSLKGKIGTGAMVNAYNSVSIRPEGAPYVLSTDPVNGAGNVASDKAITIKFNESIQPGDNFTSITLKKDNVVVPSTGSISGSNITLIPSVLENNSKYTVEIPAAAVVDVDGVSSKYPYLLTFSTLDTISPKIISTVPVDNAADVPVEDSRFTIAFSEEIDWGENISNITINGKSLRDTPCDWGVYQNELNIYVPGPLPYNTKYTITVPKGSIPDLNGNTNDSDYSFNFTTVSASITVKYTSIESGAQNIALNRPVNITFNDKVQEGANYSNIALSANNQDVPIVKTIVGNTLTLQPVKMLDKGTNYMVTLPSDSLVSTTSGNLVNPYTLRFTTTNSDFYDLSYEVDDAVMDSVNPIIYMLDKNSGVLHAYNFESNTSQSLELPYKAWSIDIGKGQYSNELYVGLYGDKNSTVTTGTGSIAIIDKNSLEIKDTITTEKPAFDIIAGRDNYIYVTPTLDQWTEISSYDRVTKTKKMSSDIYEKCYAELHPTLNRIYTIDTTLSPRDYRAYNISEGAFTDPVYPGGYDSPYHGDYPLDTNFALDPTGKYIFNGSGVIFSTAQEKAQDMKYVTKLNEGFKDIAFENDLSSFYTLDKTSNSVDIYRGNGFSFERTVPLEGSGKFLFKRDNKLITVFETNQTGVGIFSGMQIVDIPDRNPFILSVTPEDKSVNVPLDQVFTVTFSENIYNGTAADGISLTTSSGSKIAFTKTIEGNKLYIKPDVLSLNTNYNLSILPGAVIDSNGLPLGEALNISFSTDMEPTITSSFPFKDAVNVIVDGNLTVCFSENIYPGSAYKDITLRDANNNIVNMTTVDIWGTSLKIWHDPFNYSSQYTLTIPAGAVKDATGNELSSSTTISFTTINDIYPPKITGSSISSGATNVRPSDPIILTFNEAVTAGDAYNNITLKDSSLNPAAVSTSISGSKLIITPSNLKANTRYILNVPVGAVKDLAGNAWTEGLLTSYTTGDFEAPKITTMDPVEGTIGVAIDKTIALTFDENIYAGSNYGAIALKDSSGNSVGTTKTISNNTLNIKPASLNYGTSYKLTLPAGAVKDNNGNEIGNEITLTFTTQNETIPPILVSSSPANNSTGVSLMPQIILHFSEKVEIADVSLIAIKSGDVSAAFTSNIVNGTDLVLTPKTKLRARTTYTVTVGAEAVRDIAGNINKTPYIFNFTTGKR